MMMKKISGTKTSILIILGALLVLASGCSEDFFDKQAGDRITPDKHYQSLIDSDISLWGIMTSLQDVMPKLIILDGLRSDMMEVTPYADLSLREINRQVFSTENPYTSSADLYKVIVNANEVLAHIADLEANERNFDDHYSRFYTGAVLSMRAWAYLTIARLHNEAAYIKDNLTSLPENFEENVLSKDVLMDTLINQLLPYVYDATKITQEELEFDFVVNTKGMLGELYMERQDYVNATYYLKLACESYMNTAYTYKVDRTYQDEAWANIFLNAESQRDENISVVPFSRAENQLNPLAYWLGHNYDYLVRPTQTMIDLFMAQIPAAGNPGDLYRGLGITFGLDTLSKVSETEFVTEAYITKYAVDVNDPFSSDIIISRAADLHLLLAEAYNRMGDATSQGYALMLLNQGVNKENPKPTEFAKWRNNIGIRGRVYLNPTEVPDEVTGDARTRMIEDMIIEERALELAFEGKRWFDLVRVAERRGEPEYLADRVAAKFAGMPEYNTVRQYLMNPDNWYLPE
jgi:hypothetical protein